eukprot:TRINITY_DN44198_c0_g1_i1.p1 TRINITY_DN44198_c0_g1~~TRINITY_DN44198_c0_g1_i1.p1  ORF type:complete len:474 (+),score=95.63 TRINITY_DN44198_c0_g1_i1:55-1476(+)
MAALGPRTWSGQTLPGSEKGCEEISSQTARRAGRGSRLPRLSFAHAVLAASTGVSLCLAAPEPLLDVMYLKYKQQPIDTTPVFNSMVVQYQATLDWKMKFFSVQASPLGDAFIENIHLCPVEADCLKQDQTVVTMDFSRNILVEPGSTILYKFDVLLQGQVRSYSIMVHRLNGTETAIRHMIVQGSSMYPDFTSNGFNYRCFLDVGMEMALLELHLQDAGQTILAQADAPSPIGPNDNITTLVNVHPGHLRSPPLRRLREEAYGEFQYPNKYLQFPVPMGEKRMLNLKVVSADGGHFGFYSLELGRDTCSKGAPLFDVVSGKCVRFCNTGYWPDYQANRCKRCPDLCDSCLSGHRCVACPSPSSARVYELDNVTGTCVARDRSIWERNPERAASIALAAGGLAIFACGLAAFHMTPAKKARKKAADGKRPRATGSAEEDSRWKGIPRASYNTGSGKPSTAGYMKVASEDHDDF